ncbi:FAD-dependent oxidoreductase [Streptomyces sp. NPDC056296]|uniref:FAD-dependent oxidoreductase n=1 Tax=Streptomyces sp. NPDC056296 TaxID=3345775 RepID=UPI0035E21EF4
MAGFRQLNGRIFEAFDAQRAAGVDAATYDTAVLAAFAQAGQSAGLLHELDGVAAARQPVEVELLTGDQARTAEPNLSGRVVSAVRVRGQRCLDPVAYTGALAERVRARGGKTSEHVTVTGVDRRAGRLRVECAER